MMAELQICHRKSSLVLFARFPVVKWRSRSVAKSEFTQQEDRNCEEDGKTLVREKRDRAITCVLRRDPHLTLMFSGISKN